jgi:hypothetical protein
LTVTKEATCTDGGERHEVCDHCGYSWFHSYINPIGHALEVEEDAPCPNCGEPMLHYKCANCDYEEAVCPNEEWH